MQEYSACEPIPGFPWICKAMRRAKEIYYQPQWHYLGWEAIPGELQRLEDSVDTLGVQLGAWMTLVRSREDGGGSYWVPKFIIKYEDPGHTWEPHWAQRGKEAQP